MGMGISLVAATLKRRDMTDICNSKAKADDYSVFFGESIESSKPRPHQVDSDVRNSSNLLILIEESPGQFMIHWRWVSGENFASMCKCSKNRTCTEKKFEQAGKIRRPETPFFIASIAAGSIETCAPGTRHP